MSLIWYLLEDFFEQSIVMKAFIAWGWLSVVIMLIPLVQLAASAVGMD